jgi:hypothetical protein
MSDDPSIERTYHDNPDECDLSELMVVENIVSGRKDLVPLFRENKLGVDVDVCAHCFTSLLSAISNMHRFIGQLSYHRVRGTGNLK